VIEMAEISNKLLAKRNEQAQNERIDVMYTALHEWRAAIVKAMGERVAAVGSEPDEMLSTLQGEMMHLSFVAAALSADPEGMWLMNGGKP
jgi:class 3 adenylate cyclase